MLVIDSPASPAWNDPYPVDASRCCLDPDSLWIGRVGDFRVSFLRLLWLTHR